MRNPTLALGLSWLLLLAHAQPALVASTPLNFQDPIQQSPTVPAQAQASQAQQTPTLSEQSKSATPGQFVLQDGTPIKLRLNRNVSSADATVGEQVDFEVLEEVVVEGVVVIPKGGTAIGSVTEAQAKRRMARGGKLEIVLDYVRLVDTEKAAVRAVKDAKGGGHVGGMTAGIVVTGLLFWPAAPFFLFMHGKDITVPKGAEVTAYINGDERLDPSKFGVNINVIPPPSSVSSPTSIQSDVAAIQKPPTAPEIGGSIDLNSTPDGAEVYVDGAFVGNTPAKLKLAPGQHTIRVSQPGYKDWSRDLSVQGGSEVHLAAALARDDKDPDFKRLTSLLHWKTDSAGISQGDLDAIFNSMFNCKEKSANPGKKVMDVIEECANECLKAGEGINFENKIVLSIAIRIAAEKFMIGKIKDDQFVANITANQTSELFNKFKQKFGENGASRTLSRVLLMTPESIHLNSFMYEPILDMSDGHFRNLLNQVRSLK